MDGGGAGVGDGSRGWGRCSGKSVKWGVVGWVGGGVVLVCLPPDTGESLKASSDGGRVKQMGDSGTRGGPLASAESANVNAAAIFPRALTKPGDSFFQCNHLCAPTHLTRPDGETF